MVKDDIKLPYHADIELFEKMITDLKTSGSDGVNLDTLWADIGATKNGLRSFTLSLAKFLGLVDSDTKKAWLTEFGTTLRYMSKDERNKKLATVLPDKYLTMFKWIRDEKELRSNELKRKFIETWGNIISAAVLDRVIATFLNYCDWLGVVTYQGRGNQAKAIITDLGKRILELPPDKIKTDQTQDDSAAPPNEKQSKGLSLPESAIYPIIIKTNDRDFHWDIKSEADWTVIDSVIASIKEGWKIKQPENSSNRIEGKDSGKTT